MNKRIATLLNKLDLTRHEFWNISKETGLFLNALIRTSNIKRILEIGTSNGVSAIYMAEALKSKGPHTTHRIYTIESNFKLRFPLATANFAKANLSSYITQILGHAPEVIPSRPLYFDLIFLDATKYEHADYLKAILPRTRPGSIIITDNAISHADALKPYFKKITALKNFETHLLNIGSGLLTSMKI